VTSEEVLLVGADRGQAWKPLVPAVAVAAAGVACAALAGPGALWPALLLVVVLGGIYLARAALWSWMGDLVADEAGLTYRPRRGDDFRVAWHDVTYARLDRGAPVLPQWHVARSRGPLPVLHLHLRRELRHDRRPGCVQAGATPGLEGFGPHAERSGRLTWELSLLVRPSGLPEAQRRLAAELRRRGIAFDGTERYPRGAGLPRREGGQDASG
jgi:hypothetical protein